MSTSDGTETAHHHTTKRKKRRTMIVIGSVATVGLTGALVVPTAMADRTDETSPQLVDTNIFDTDLLGDVNVEELTRDDGSLPAMIPVGEEVTVADTISYGDVLDVLNGHQIEESDQLQMVYHQADASYVKVHFDDIQLADDDVVTVSSPDGEEVHTLDSSLTDDWAMSITGDTAIVQVHPDTDPADVPSDTDALGVFVDRVAFGLPEDEVDDVASDMEAHNHIEESICGSDDKAPSVCYEDSFPDAFANTEPVGRLLLDGTVLCTAFLVGDGNTLLTNNHCFDSSEEAQRAEIWFNYQCVSCDSSATTTPVKVNGTEVIATDRDLDYTLFSVNDYEAIEQFGSLTLATERASVGDQIYIPQHPAGRPSELAVNSIADNGACVISHDVYDGYVGGTDVAYMCDTEFGSSGSPVIDANTHEVVALHHFGGCPNSGVSADQIHEEIKDLI